MAGFNVPSLPGGEHKIISLHPASFAGIPSIKIVENNWYICHSIPTIFIATLLLQHCITGIISINFCRLQLYRVEKFLNIILS